MTNFGGPSQSARLSSNNRYDLFTQDSVLGPSVLVPKSTYIAAEKLARRCSAMELHPQHADVAVRRWQSYTGKRAVLEAAGEPFPE